MTHWPGYRIHQILHESTRSTLVRATRLEDGRSVILKFPHGNGFDRHRALELRREYAITRRVEGEGILRALGLEELSGERVALILEDIAGTSMRHVLDAQGPLAVDTFLQFAIRISTALGHIHRQGVIHKDLKPQNLIVNAETAEVKVADFSLSAAISLEAATPESPARLVGTLAYMAPEQTGRMNRGVDTRADFYALGATFFEMLTGRRAFPSNSLLELLHAHLAQLPPSPRDVLPELPEPLADIVLKLLSKHPDARYQSTSGLIADLEECLRQLRERGRISVFTLGSADRVHAFRLPQGLYGRGTNVALLAEAHAHAASGRSHLLLITGSAGIGKSSLVNELHRVSASSKGRFVAGKCDQYLRGVPLDAAKQALRQLVHQTQAESEEERAEVSQRLRALLGSTVSVLVEAVPEMRSLLGPQPAPVSLPAVQSKNRLILSLARAFQAFATPGCPLTLFLDDLQWAGSATLSLVRTLARDFADVPLLLIGAYRDAEVTQTHPLTDVLDELRAANTPLTQLHLSPLDVADVARMVHEATAVDTERALELGRFIHTRTRGNPFSVKEFLRFLYEKRLIHLDAHGGQWTWELRDIDAREVPEDIAGLMAAELQQLPEETGALLQVAACLGVAFSFRDLLVAQGGSSVETGGALWSAIERGLVLPLSKDYLLLDPQGPGAPSDLEVPLRFLHDKVRQGAYALLDPTERAEAHVRVGLRLLEDARAQGRLEERVFFVLPHFAHAPERIAPAALRLELADLHLSAGRRAKASGAYRMACDFFRTGGALLPVDAWQHEHARAFALQMELAESSYWAGEFELARSSFSTLLEQARTPTQRASVHCMQAVLMSLSGRDRESLEMGLVGLRLLGIELPESADSATVAVELRALSTQLEGRRTMDLLELPWTHDPRLELPVSLIGNILTSAYRCNPFVFALLVLRGVSHSLTHGNSRLSAFCYATYGLFLSSVLDDPEKGWEFGQLAMRLATRLQDPMMLARVNYTRAGFIDHWTHSVRAANLELAEAFQASTELGDWVHAKQCLQTLLRRRLSVGEPLLDLQQENRKLMELSARSQDTNSLAMCIAQNRVMQTLLGSEEQAPISEPGAQMEKGIPRAAIHLYKAEQHYHLGQYPQALEETERLVPLLPFFAGLFTVSTHAFFHALSAAAVFAGAGEDRQRELLTAVERHHAALEKCARRIPENFAPYQLLVGAELLRMKQQPPEETLRTYERAIAAARASGFVFVEALANERAFRFLASQDARAKALAFLLEALEAYARWGASGKARLLASEQTFFLDAFGKSLRHWSKLAERTGPSPQPVGVERGAASTSSPLSSEAFAETLDVSSVMKASQAISSELLFPQLVANLIQIVIESAGAQRGVLVLKRGEEFHVEAVAEVASSGGQQVAAHALERSDVLCLDIASRVLETGSHVLLDDASLEASFLMNAYLQARGVRSVLCAPILHRRQVVGLFYLENNLIPGAFNSSRLKVLGMLSAQAAISVENAGLYRRLEEYNHTLEQRVHDRTEELHQKNAKLQSTLETLQSIQQRIITQEKLASLGSLTAGIAHELRNPLNFVNNFSDMSLELLQELREELNGLQSLSTPPAKRFGGALEDVIRNTAKVREHGRRASNIISGMLQHAHSRRGEAQLIRVNSLVEDVVQLVHHSLRAKSPSVHLFIETALDPSVPPLLLVPEDIRRVLLNLVDNACYAAHKKAHRLGPSLLPQVRISSRWDGASLEVRVRDNGDGVPKDVRDKLFTPFFTTKPPGDGTGLGLSISHDIIVISLGGELRLESEEGLFAEFIISLPGGNRAPRAD